MPFTTDCITYIRFSKVVLHPHHFRCAVVLARGGSGEIGGDTDERGGIRLPYAPVGRHGDELKAPVSGDDLQAPASGDELKAPASGDERAGASPDRHRGCKPPRRRRRAPLFLADECRRFACCVRRQFIVSKQIIAIVPATPLLSSWDLCPGLIQHRDWADIEERISRNITLLHAIACEHCRILTQVRTLLSFTH